MKILLYYYYHLLLCICLQCVAPYQSTYKSGKAVAK